MKMNAVINNLKIPMPIRQEIIKNGQALKLTERKLKVATNGLEIRRLKNVEVGLLLKRLELFEFVFDCIDDVRAKA